MDEFEAEVLLALDTLLREARAARHERHEGAYRDDCVICRDGVEAAVAGPPPDYADPLTFRP